jgi:hypothetical protein
VVAFPADQSLDVPPDQSVVYESPDLLIQIDSVGPGASYIASPVSQEMQFLGYDVIDPLSAPGVSEITSPDGGLEFIASAGTSDFLLSPALGAPVDGVLQIDIAPGGPPVALAELGPPTGGISLGFADPFAGAGTLNVGVPLPGILGS